MDSDVQLAQHIIYKHCNMVWPSLVWQSSGQVRISRSSGQGQGHTIPSY